MIAPELPWLVGSERGPGHGRIVLARSAEAKA